MLNSNTADNLAAGLHILSVAHDRFELKAICASGDLVIDLISRPVEVHEFRMLDWTGRWNDPFFVPTIVVASESLFGLHSLDLLPAEVCPVEGVVPQVASVVAEISTHPLREFVHQVLENRSIFNQFWAIPASARHHHAHPGGLAEHSLEVACDLATQSQLKGSERDLAIAGGLLHDIGKVWAYTPDMFPSAASLAMGHELLGLVKLARPLELLETDWPDGANAMRALLSGFSRVRSDGSLQSALVTRIRAADQRSCERANSQSQRRSRSWIPKPWEPSNGQARGGD